jgi:serine/threonine-protein kinase
MQRAGKYEIVRKIGAGGFGVVYEGRDPFIKRRVAIKACTTEDEEIRQRFYREAEIAGNLQHKNIVTIHDFGIEDGVPYLVQEYLTGEDLEHVIARGEPIPLERKLDILIQAAHGLEHAHAAGVIHRDIKPANVRLLDDGRVKILDFGIAKLAHVESRLTKEGMTVGTAAYLPPEQIRGEKIDFRADVFSFGVLAYELLAMVRPFDGKTLSTLLFQILSQTPRPLAEALPGVPARLAAVIDRCLEKDVERRFGSFAEIATELETLRSELPAGSAGAGPAGVDRGAPAGATEAWTRTETIAPAPVAAEPSSDSFGTPLPPRPGRRGRALAVAAGLAGVVAAGVWLLRAGGSAAPEAAPAPAPVAAVPAAGAERSGPVLSPAASDPPSPSSPGPAIERPASPAAPQSEPRPPVRETPRAGTAPARAAAPEPGTARGDRPGTAPSDAAPAARAAPGATPPEAAPGPPPAPATVEPPPATAAATAAGTAAPAAAAAGAPPEPALSPEEGVRKALAEYVAAFNRLDKPAVRKIFPTVPDENFEGLADFQSYRMDLAISKLDVKLPRVLVEARITHTWVTFSGKRDSATRKEKMTFLQGPDGAWMRVQ